MRESKSRTLTAWRHLYVAADERFELSRAINPCQISSLIPSTTWLIHRTNAGSCNPSVVSTSNPSTLSPAYRCTMLHQQRLILSSHDLMTPYMVLPSDSNRDRALTWSLWLGIGPLHYRYAKGAYVVVPLGLEPRTVRL